MSGGVGCLAILFTHRGCFRVKDKLVEEGTHELKIELAQTHRPYAVNRAPGNKIARHAPCECVQIRWLASSKKLFKNSRVLVSQP